MMRLNLAFLALLLPLGAGAQEHNRGIGKYPGAPTEFFGPKAMDNDGFRNLALHRAAYASSCRDYNLTAHLVTDGICNDDEPAWMTVSTPQGILPKREAEWAIDGGPYSHHVLTGGKTWLQYDWNVQTFSADKLVLDARVAYRHRDGSSYRIVCEVSDDGTNWTTIGRLEGDTLPGRPMNYQLPADPNKQANREYLPARMLDQSIDFGRTVTFSHFRLKMEMEGAAHWDIHDLHFFDNKQKEVWLLPSQQFCSMWVSEGGGRQWLRIDLGGKSTVGKVTPHWYQEPRKWHYETEDEGRSVTLVMEEPNESGYYALRELEIWGWGGQDFEAHDAAPAAADRKELSGGNWRLQRASEVSSTGERIASEDFDDKDWIIATVPGTILTSYLNIGAIPDTDTGDNVDQISESFFNADFWYRHVFYADQPYRFLHFDGINWKARVYMNGQMLGRIDGAFMRGCFDIGPYIRMGKNVLAVEIIRNEHFGVVKEKDENTTQFNGGILGADNPTFHASIGWDWITTVRGREAGIWNEVYLTNEQEVTIADPYVKTEILPNGQKRVTPSVFVRNNNPKMFQGTLEGWIGDTRFEQDVTLNAHEEKEIAFSPDDYPQLTGKNFRLWWPNGYGTPYLYMAGFSMNGSELNYKAGLRQMEYVDEEDSLRIYINKRRFVPLGGNWGFDEHNLRYREREYQAAVAYHQDMNCTMIRNWVGQIGDEKFYEACDEQGLMVWQDFWLANPADGPDPYDNTLFTDNARDYLRRMRSHPCIAIYCGRNEGYPPETIDKALRQMIADMAPGLGYIPSSADDGVSGHGPYWALPAKEYFERQTGKIHTERGMPCVMNIESMTRALETDHLWPQNKVWGKHDYTLMGAQRAREFNKLVAQTGQPDDAEEFSRYAQLINYNGYRAMFESTSKKRAGLLIWMSHPCWPTMVWQTYDYYLDPTAAYFGVKKACEPLHVQYNALTDSIELVNMFAGDQKNLRVHADIFDKDGTTIWTKTVSADSKDDTTTQLMLIDSRYTRDGLYFLRLQIEGQKENTYILGDYSLLPTLPQTTVTQQVSTKKNGNENEASLSITNTGNSPAVFLRVNLKGEDGEQILPVIYSDNYQTLMPKETRIVTIKWKDEDSRDCRPVVEIKGLN